MTSTWGGYVIDALIQGDEDEGSEEELEADQDEYYEGQIGLQRAMGKVG